MKLTRRVAFSSGHRYWFSELSPEENRAVFGRWASPYNHGHNYVLEVTVSGKIDPRNGMVVNIKAIDDILQDRIVSRYDQKSLNDEVAEFSERSTSCEVIATEVRRIVSDELPNHVALTNIRLYENPLLFVDLGETDTVQLTRVYEFSASHRLDVPALSEIENIELFGKCNNMAGHGHNYILEVTVSGNPDSRTGMIADLEAIDEVVEAEVVDRYDHKHLNVDIPEFAGLNPTTEVLTRMIWSRLNGKLPAKLDKVTVRETARNIFEYSGEDE
ncbi:MAG: 6-carboxytetrahydropterin synthase [Armatimonadota bacterium]|nr:6-carboxytetrahydropterin synthase [Armatimonadota bacterium]